MRLPRVSALLKSEKRSWLGTSLGIIRGELSIVMLIVPWVVWSLMTLTSEVDFPRGCEYGQQVNAENRQTSHRGKRSNRFPVLGNVKCVLNLTDGYIEAEGENYSNMAYLSANKKYLFHLPLTHISLYALARHRR